MIKKNILLILFIIISLNHSQAQWIQIGENIDGEAANDRAGYSISLSADGSIVALSSPFNDGNGSLQGHVRIYQIIGNSWLQIGQDINGDSDGDWSGWSVSLSADGMIVAIGSPFGDGDYYASGEIRVYKYINENWIQIGQEISGEASETFAGWSVSLSADGSILAIGAPRDRGFNNLHYFMGTARVYRNIDNNWIQIGEDLDGEASEDTAGSSVELNSDGTILAVGAPYNDGDHIDSGHVRIYKNVNDSWTIIGEIHGEWGLDYVGNAVSFNVDGTIIAIGSARNSHQNGTSSGHVRIFQYDGVDWLQIGDDIDGASAYNYFGTSVSLNSSGNVLAIGAVGDYNNGNDAGYVQTYININGMWSQIGNSISGEGAGDMFGNSVCMSSIGSILAIGARQNDGNGIDAGRVKVYENTVIGINEIQNYKATIYPNPSKGIFTFRIQNKKSKIISVFDTLGNLVLKETSFDETEKIDLTKFKNGIYLVKIQINDTFIIKKIVKS